MSFINSFASTFNPALQRATEDYQKQQNLDRDYELRKSEAGQASQLRDLQIAQARLGLGQAQQQDAAQAALLSATRDGMQTGSAQGLSAPSQQMLFQGGYGGATGADAVRNATTDYQLEMRRFAGSENAPQGGLPTYDASGVGQQAASRRQLLGLRTNLAVAQGKDIGGMLNEGRQLDIEDTTKKNIEQLANDPTYWTKIAPHLNLNNGRVTIDDGIDPKTKKQVRAPRISFVQDDGGVHAVEPTLAQKKQIALGLAHMENGDSATGLQIISGVDKTLGELARSEFDRQGKEFDSNTKALGEFDMANYRRQHLGIEAGKAQRENAALQRLQMGDRIGAEAAGYASGVSRAQGLGAEGKDALNMYNELLAGANARLSGLGMKPIEVGRRSAMSPMEQIEARAKLKAAGYPDEKIEAMVGGIDPMQVLRDMLANRGKDGGKPAPVAKPAATQGPQRIPAPPPQTTQRGLSSMPNPAYSDWQQQYGNAYGAQQSADDAASAADAARLAGYNPYAQNRPR